MKSPHWFWPALITAYAAVGIIIYSPSLPGPWQYDDHSQILDKEVLLVHSAPKFFLNSFKFFPEANGRLTNRDVVRAFFRLNWDWWGNNPAGYRWVNLLIHTVNAVLVAVFCWLLLAYNNYKNKVILSDESARSRRIQRSDTNIPATALDSSSKTPQNDGLYIWFSAFAGLLFLVHPIQSQAVAYIAQRFTSIATMFYLGAVVFYILYNRYNHYKYYVAAFISAALAFSSKEISITLPIILLLVTWLAVRYNNYKNYSRYKIYLALIPFMVLALKVPLQLFWSSLNFNAGFQANQIIANPQTISEAFSLKQTATNLSRRDYFLTQINVVRTYQRLLILPFGQTLDWDYPLTTASDFKTILTLISHISLITLGAFLLFNRQFFVIARSPESVEGRRGNLAAQPDRHDPSGLAMTAGLQLIGAGILWFYLTLLPESSVIPIIDVIYEHRVYLPMVGVCVAFAGVFSFIFQRFPGLVRNYFYFLLSIFYFLFSIAAFNRAYIWGDQIRLWADTVTKAPHKARTNKNYGVVLAAAGRYSEGIKYLQKAIELKPNDADYHSNLGTAYLRSGQYQLAADQFQQAYDLYLMAESDLTSKDRQQLAQYLNDYGVANVQINQGETALTAFEKALEISPGFYSARLGLGAAYNIIGQRIEAIKIFSQLVADYPEQADAYNNLAVMYEKTENWPEALKTLTKLQSIQPNYPNIKERIKKLESKLY